MPRVPEPEPDASDVLRGATKPLRKDAARNRQRVLDAARTVFAREGLDATMEDIAAEAGLGVGTVYRRFENKDALVDALFSDGLTALTGLADEATAFPRAFDGLRHFWESMMRLQIEDKGMRDLMIARQTEAAIGERLQPLLEELVSRAQHEGDLRLDLAATDFVALEIAVQSAAAFTSLVAPDAWRRYVAIVLDGMRTRTDGALLPLKPEAITHAQAYAAADGWRYGTNRTTSSL